MPSPYPRTLQPRAIGVTMELIQTVCSHCATLISLASTHGPLATAIWGVAPGDVAGLSTSEDYTADHRLQCVTCGDDEPGARTHVRLSGPVPFIPGYVEVPVVNVFTTPVDDVDLDADHLHLVGDGHDEPLQVHDVPRSITATTVDGDDEYMGTMGEIPW